MNKALFEQGLKIRKKVLGDAYVAQSLSQSDEVSVPIQEFSTQYCWGAVWNRPVETRQ